MAEAVVLRVLLNNLATLMKDETGLIMGVDDEINKLSSTLTTILAVLADAEDKQFESHAIRDWLCKLHNLIYEIEDVLDEFATEVAKLEHNNSKLNCYNPKKIQFRHKIGRQVKEVTAKLDAVAAEHQNFHLDVKLVERQSDADTTTRETGSILSEPDLVFGRDEEREKIVDILVNHVKDSQQLAILPIIGIGGLGKTTLAQLVFNDPRVTKHFDPKFWVCVSDNFDTKTLVKAMIESATKKRSDCDNLDTLQNELRDLLQHKRFLIILDDVWNEDQDKWYELKAVLECGSSGASIVVTTRSKKVAEIMGTLPAHNLSGLLEEHCWLLFKQRAFGQETVEQHHNLESIGRQIVKKCSGVPLAAKALGGLLRFKREEKEWRYVKDSAIMSLPYDETLILPALRLSYQHLPLHLRRCFAYCAVYPKDYKMEKKELIFCWRAHGYISSKRRMDVEDVGNEVWNELFLRSLFQDVETNYEGQTTFKMHDLVHDLAQSIMESKFPGAQVESSDQSAFNKNKIRQVNVRKQYVAFPTSFQEEVNMSYTIKTFNRLRMLDASYCVHEEFSLKIGNLKHLRYLNLSSNSFIQTLPDTICSLWNLEILNLNYCTGLVRLPKNMRNMKNLRHLLLERCYKLREMPPKIGELIYLKTLSVFIVGHQNDKQLDQLQHLNLEGRLEIRHLERVKTHSDANISEKSNLRELVLEWESGKASEQQQEMDEKLVAALVPPSTLETLKIVGFRGRYIPTWTRMENITQIEIRGSPNCLRLPQLGDLPRLKSLDLSNLCSLEYVMENNQVKKKDATKLFPSLEFLQLECLPKLKGLLLKDDDEDWEDEEGLECLKTLKELDIDGCDTLKCLPWLRHLTALETLKIHNCKELEELLPATAEGKKSLLNSSLKSLELYTLPKMKECLSQHLSPSLESLQLWFLPELTSLPEWLGNFTSLQHLNICDCPRLTSLPPSIKGMTNLKTLYISCKENGELKRRCEKEKGEDWHLISHIPKVRIY